MISGSVGAPWFGGLRGSVDSVDLCSVDAFTFATCERSFFVDVPEEHGWLWLGV